MYIDFQKGFDVVSHEKLFHRLYHYGIRGNVLLWLKNFFTGRTRQIKTAKRTSASSEAEPHCKHNIVFRILSNKNQFMVMTFAAVVASVACSSFAEASLYVAVCMPACRMQHKLTIQYNTIIKLV